MKNLKCYKNFAYNEKSVRVYLKKQLHSGATRQWTLQKKYWIQDYYAPLAKPRINYPCIAKHSYLIHTQCLWLWVWPPKRKWRSGEGNEEGGKSVGTELRT